MSAKTKKYPKKIYLNYFSHDNYEAYTSEKELREYATDNNTILVYELVKTGKIKVTTEIV